MIDWTKPLCTKHDTPLIGERQSNDGDIVRIALSSRSVPTWGPTIYRFDEKGRARQGAGASEYDLVNYDPEDGTVRITISGQKIVCSSAKAA